MGGSPTRPETLHATAVAVGQSALLLTGASGSGKSTLALEMIGQGATLVADDQVALSPKDGVLWLSAPGPLRDRIEARHLGILACPTAPSCARAVVDLDSVETERMPEPRTIVIEGVTLPLIRKVESPAFATMLRLYLLGGLVDDT